MKLVVAATSEVAIPAIQKLIPDHEVKIITQPDRPAGRGKKLQATPISLAFPTALKPESEAEFSQALAHSDLLITIGYGRLLKESTLRIPKFGGINLHFSLLPKWRGAAPVQRAIEAGDKFSGVSVFQMDSKMDTGPIWVQKVFEIPYGFSSSQLFQSLSALGAESLLETLVLINSKESPSPQSGTSTIARKISKDECRIDWSADCAVVLRKIRAFSANPGVYSFIRGEQIKILSARECNAKLQPGQLNSAGEVGTGDGAIQLLEIVPAGKRAMLISDWLNGFKLQPGELFE
jgi:methionyl-tRNA formyltransferase